MNYESMNIEQMKNRMQSLHASIDICSKNIETIRTVLNEYNTEYYKLLSIVDNLELKDIIEKSFITQVEYALNEYSYARSTQHIKWCEEFFSVLNLSVGLDSKSIHFTAEPSFIKENFDYIIQYLPIAFLYCEQKYQMETEVYHNIKIYYNPMVESINYYPRLNQYWTDGVYIRKFDNLHSLLNHMMEEL